MFVINVLDLCPDLHWEAMPKGVQVNCAGFGIYTKDPDVQVVTKNYGWTWSPCRTAVNKYFL